MQNFFMSTEFIASMQIKHFFTNVVDWQRCYFPYLSAMTMLYRDKCKEGGQKSKK